MARSTRGGGALRVARHAVVRRAGRALVPKVLDVVSGEGRREAPVGVNAVALHAVRVQATHLPARGVVEQYG